MFECIISHVIYKDVSCCVVDFVTKNRLFKKRFYLKKYCKDIKLQVGM